MYIGKHESEHETPQQKNTRTQRLFDHKQKTKTELTHLPTITSPENTIYKLATGKTNIQTKIHTLAVHVPKRTQPNLGQVQQKHIFNTLKRNIPIHRFINLESNPNKYSTVELGHVNHQPSTLMELEDPP